MANVPPLGRSAVFDDYCIGFYSLTLLDVIRFQWLTLECSDVGRNHVLNIHYRYLA